MQASEWRADPASLFAFSDRVREVPTPNAVSDVHRQKLEEILRLPQPGPLRRRLEALAGSVYAHMGERSRWLISSAAKRALFGEWHFDFDRARSPELMHFARLFEHARYDRRPGVLLMTHDVDYRRGYNLVLAAAEKEAGLGIRACYYFLTGAQYRIDRGALDALVSMGHEAGVHGLDYDLRLAYRSARSVLAKIRRAKQVLEDLLGRPVHGFRNHSLQLSYPILEALEALGFQYDTGLYPREKQDGFNIYYCWPFQYLHKRLYEIPVLWPQDMEVFRMVNWQDDQAFNYFRKRLELVGEMHGVACLNTHPSIFGEHPSFFDRLLAFVRDSALLNTTPSAFLQRAVAHKEEP